MRFTNITWIACLILIAAGPATRPAAVSPLTGPTTAQWWVDRSDRALATMPTTQSFGASELAVAVYRASPSDVRRAAAAALILAQTRPVDDRAVDREQMTEDLSHAALWMAEIGDLHGAAEIIAACDALPPEYSQFGFGSADAEWERASALTWLGRGDEIGTLHYSNLPMRLAATFRDVGRDDLADAFLAQAHQRGALSGERFHELADAGFYKEALGAATVDGHPMSTANERIEVAKIALDAGDTRPLAIVRKEMLNDLRTQPPNDSRYSLAYLLNVSVKAGEREGVADICDYYEKHPVDPVDDQTLSALACADVGLADEARRHARLLAESAAADIARPKADWFSKFETSMKLAQVYARLGDVASVNKTIASIYEPPERQEILSDFAYSDLATAYAAAGRYDEAIRHAKGNDPGDYWMTADTIACEMAFAGHGNDGRRLIADLEPSSQIPAHYYMAVRQAKRREDLAGLAEWIDRVPIPAERVFLDVAVADVLSGRRNRDVENDVWDCGPHRAG